MQHGCRIHLSSAQCFAYGAGGKCYRMIIKFLRRDSKLRSAHWLPVDEVFSARGLKEIRGGTKLGSGWYNWGEIRRIKTFLFNSRKIESRRKLRNIRYFRYKTVSWCWLVPYRKSQVSRGLPYIPHLQNWTSLTNPIPSHSARATAQVWVIFNFGLGWELNLENDKIWNFQNFFYFFMQVQGPGCRSLCVFQLYPLPVLEFQIWTK